MTMMLGTDNRIEESTLSGGSWLAALPLNNVKNKQIGRVARSSDATNASTKFDIDLTTAERVIRVISLVNHNFSLTAQYRIRGATDSGFTSLLYDSGTVDVWPSVYPPGTAEWESTNFWTGQYTSEDISTYTTNLCVILDTNIALARYWRVEIFDSSNADGYVEIGRVFIGSGYIPVNDASTGLSIGWETPTTVTKSLSGAKYFQSRTPYRVVNFELDVMTVDEGMANLFEIDKRLGIDKEVIYIFDIDDTFHSIRRRFIGTMRQLNPILYPHANITTKNFVIEENL